MNTWDLGIGIELSKHVEKYGLIFMGNKVKLL